METVWVAYGFHMAADRPLTPQRSGMSGLIDSFS
jgi:hypothetical protein